MKFQILIECDSHQEMGEVVQALGRVPQLSSSSSAPVVMQTAGLVTPNPVPLQSTHQHDEEDENTGDADPSVIFGAQDAAQIFAPVPNAGAMVVPTTPVQPATSAVSATTGDVELDPRGFPWDGRIHSSNRTRLKGTNNWKYARGVSQQDINNVEAELISKGFGKAQGLVQSTPTPVTPAQAPVQETPIGLPGGLPGLPPVSAQPVITGPTAQSVTERFTRAIASRLVTSAWIMEVLAAFGVANLQLLAQMPEKVGPINDYLDQVKAQPGFENF